MTSWIWWVVIGGLSLLFGILAIANPFAATLTAEYIAAWMFMTIGVLQIISAFRETAWSGRIWAGIVGVLSLVVGVSLFANPLEGILSLTLVVALLFLFTGVAKVILAIQQRSFDYWWVVLLSGIISVILALMILTNLPVAAAGVLGILLGVELISNGIGLIALGLTRRRIGRLTDSPAAR